MANRYVRSTGGNSNTAGTWELTPGGGETVAVPTAADEVYLVAGSGQLTINAAMVCRKFDCTGYASTITHGAYSLTIGDGTAPTGGVALVLAGTYTPNASSSIIFNSTGAGTHTINTGGKTTQIITFNAITTANYQFVISDVIVTTLNHASGTIDFNGLAFTISNAISITNANAKTLTLGASVITFTANTTVFNYSGSNLTITANTATFIVSATSPNITVIDSTNFNGTTFKFIGGAGTGYITNTCTIANLIIDPTTTKTLAITSGKTLTITGQMYCNPKAGVVTITGGTISKASGTVNLYQVTSNTCTFTGGATWNLKNNCTAAPSATNGLIQAGGKFYIDLDNGDDTIYAAYGWSKVAYTGATGAIPELGETITGATSGSTATVSYIDADWFTGSGTIWIDTKSGVFQAEQVNCGTGGGHFDIAADFVSGAWKTISGGALAARIAQGDTMCISKTPAPTSIGDGKWTLNTLAAGGFASASSISATANNGSGLIRITKSGHGFSDGDVIQMIGVGGTLEANGAWVISYVSSTQFDLVGSVYTNAWTSGGTARQINSKAIVLTTAGQLEVDRCKVNWSNGVDGVSTRITTDHKEGGGCVKITMDASPNTNSKQAYHATGTLAGATMNGYQKLSFWIKNEVAIADNAMWYIGLCSDTVGATVIDKFVIPAIPSTGRWIPLTLTRDTGGNLGGNTSTDIKSIAIWSGASAPTASKYICVDNFIACTTSGLNLQSLISKNGSAQGGTGTFYGIQSINGKVVLVDNDTNILSDGLNGRGYYESSGTVTTYIRETFKTNLSAAGTTAISDCTDSGVLGSLISYEFGWTINGSQDGETFLDGLSGQGRGLTIINKLYVKINLCALFRYYDGLHISQSQIIYVNTISNISNCYNNGLVLSNLQSVFVDTITVNNNNYGGVYYTTVGYSTINRIKLENNSANGMNFSTAVDCIINYLYGNNNTSYAISYANSNRIDIKNLITISNYTTCSIDRGNNIIRNSINNDNTFLSASSSYSKVMLWSFMEDGSIGNNWGYGRYCTINWQTTTKYSTNPGSWKVAITNAERSTACTVPLKLAEVYAPEANKLVTVTCYVKKDHATNIAAKLIVYADALLGITESYDTKADDTDWELLTVTYTPTVANTVVDVYVESWWVAGSSNVYCGPITVTQAP